MPRLPPVDRALSAEQVERDLDGDDGDGEEGERERLHQLGGHVAKLRQVDPRRRRPFAEAKDGRRGEGASRGEARAAALLQKEEESAGVRRGGEGGRDGARRRRDEGERRGGEARGRGDKREAGAGGWRECRTSQAWGPFGKGMSCTCAQTAFSSVPSYRKPSSVPATPTMAALRSSVPPSRACCTCRAAPSGLRGRAVPPAVPRTPHRRPPNKQSELPAPRRSTPAVVVPQPPVQRRHLGGGARRPPARALHGAKLGGCGGRPGGRVCARRPPRLGEVEAARRA